jgi:hypothetical protein
MTANDFRIIGLYLYNRVDYNKFEELIEDSDNWYLEDKWNSFINEPLKFCLNHPVFLENVIKDIEKTNYQG